MKKKLSMMKQLLSLLFLLMQSYGEFGLIPRNIANSSQTCVDKRPNNRQIREIGRKVVQKCAHRSADTL
jgi:hypothetical protein